MATFHTLRNNMGSDIDAILRLRHPEIVRTITEIHRIDSFRFRLVLHFLVTYSSDDESDGFPFIKRFFTSFKSNSMSLLFCMCWMASFVSSISFNRLSRFFSEVRGEGENYDGADFGAIF